MDVGVKPKWLEHYRTAQDEGNREAQRRSAARNRPWTLMVYVAFVIAFAIAIYAWV